MSAFPLLSALAAFLAFALTTDRQHRQRFGGPCPERRMLLLRSGAWISLAMGLIAAVATWGAVFGPIVWFGTSMLGAATVFVTVNSR